MSIIYALVANRINHVLASFTDYQGGFEQISRTVLTKIQPETSGIVKQGEKKFFYENKDQITYMCLTDSVSNEYGFALIDDIKLTIVKERRNSNSNEDLSNMTGYSLNSNVSAELSELIEYYRYLPSTTKSGLPVDKFKNIKDIVTIELSTIIDTELTYQPMKKEEFGTPIGGVGNILVSFIILFFSLIQR